MRKNKYGNNRTAVHDTLFASKKEANRYQELLLLARAGKISDLILQPAFVLQESFSYGGRTYRKIEYVADFHYTDNSNGRAIIEDTKGFRTDIYKLKKKLFLFKYGDVYDFIES